MKIKIAAILLATVIGSNLAVAQNQLSNSKNVQKMKKFQINISQEAIDDLNTRLGKTRWIKETEATPWGEPALEITAIKELTDHWKDSFDWKKQEAYLNRFPQYTALVNNVNIHFVHQKGNGSKHIPILLLHGWASNFTEFLKTATLLRKENPEVDVIIPSIPGFAFSDVPDSMASETAAEYLYQLMTEVLGYTTYYVHGGDYGAFIGEKMALKFPDTVKGLHLSDIPFYHLYAPNENLTQIEKDYIQKINDWSMKDGAYFMIQGTKPKTLSTGLNDAPAALTAWILQLYFDFGDKQQPIFDRYSKDDLLVNISLYWFNQAIYPSMRIYSEDMSGFEDKSVDKVGVPVGFNFHEFDISGFVPREFAERFFSNIVSWTEHKVGGHFAGLSHPQQLKSDLITFVEKVEKKAQ